MAFELPPLPYPFDALEPHIDAKTMEIHHDKHHAAYVTNANAALEKHLTSTFGSYGSFKEQLQKAAVGQFGSGWAWLLSDGGGKLSIKSYPNQDSPYMEGHTPILGVDVWEHAYYLKYQNRRADYVTAWFNTLNWKAIAERYE